ncbi:glycosyltransferase family 2 protein [Frankia sp. Cj3]|uniref:glycosyltransferase family 2 protein n=2 Tax=unclassified Frankia TaxID=2632575 RepID=UPI001EF6BB83|nr:cellulose synthase catalytic subunit [Frankia sp. Cj3]
MAYDYISFSSLAGPLTLPATSGRYRVAYRRVMVGRELWMVLPLLVATVGLSSLFFVWLIQPDHFPRGAYLPAPVRLGNAVMFLLIVISEGIRLLNSITLCWSAFIMRDPVPVRPADGLRIAFTTTIVPAKEPIDVVRDTLIAARRIHYGTPIDIWLLDEGNDPGVRAVCADIGVHHFSRNGVERWNEPKGRFRTRTKHGNHNSWLAAHGASYDIVMSVDPDHIPLPNFAARMLGYFRDPEVAFVVGPQVYGNFQKFLTRGAEAQNYMFHSVIQRAANRFNCGMFVGTNHAYRVAAWEQIGGFQDSITEDLATSFAVHGARHPETGRRWKSVYTPDVVAVGEGPATWTDFFSQQLRWARGSNEVMVTESVRRLRKLSWGGRLHYLILMLHYPTVALTWLMGMLLTVSYMALGSSGVTVRISSWLALYIDVAVARLLLYIWLRRFNISPHEEKGTAGISGIFVSMLCTPFYSTAFVGALLRRPLGFVVTPKGRSASPDRLLTFRKHLFWAMLSTGSITVAAACGNVYPANMVWAVLSLLSCLAPVAMWAVSTVAGQRLARGGGSAAAPPPAVVHVRPADQVSVGLLKELDGMRARPAPRPAARPVVLVAAPIGWRGEAVEDMVMLAMPSTVLPTVPPAVARARAYSEQTTRWLARPAPTSPPGDPARPVAATRQKVIRAAAAVQRPTGMGRATGRPVLGGFSASSGYSAAGGHLEDVTMKLRPRRRRVSRDGLLEELT